MSGINRIITGLCCLGLSAGPGLAQPVAAQPAAASNLIVNGGFEQGLTGWDELWTRDLGTGTASFDPGERHGGAQAMRIVQTGDKDWSLSETGRRAVKPGEIFALSAWVRLQGKGDAMLSVVTRDSSGRVLDWNHGGCSTLETQGWSLLKSRFIIPLGAASMQCRLTGSGPATVWLDDVVLTQQGSLAALRNGNLPAMLAIRNHAVEVTLATAAATLTLKDLRTAQSWTQEPDGSALVVLDAKRTDNAIVLRLLDATSLRELAATLRIEADRPECVVTLTTAGGDMDAPLAWPAPFNSAKGQLLILPVNEGISYPVDDLSLPPMFYHLYGGHGLCMPWYGATDGQAGWMAIVETADDAAIRIARRNKFLHIAPQWEPQKGSFGAARVIRYVIFDAGGYVAMAKRYRAYAQATGLFKTLAEKRKAIPAVDLLVGAVNVWCWDQNAPALCREMQARGIRRILWSNQCPPDELKGLNDLGVLTSRYDIYQDAMNPTNFPRLRWVDPNWTSEAWSNRDLMIGRNGAWVRGWEVKAKDGTMMPCGTLCDRQAAAYAQKRIPADLATHPYRCRFIDTTTASPWRECYDPRHPMTRSESKQAKMDLLKYVSAGCGLVCGSETGHDAAVPYVHYFEGMLSLGPYRVPDAGRDMARILHDVPAAVATFQTGHVYRIPLWELVYHDCVVAQWYWGDYNNKLPPLWDRRDLWNALYGTPPMFMFDRKLWDADRDRFVRSYQTAAPVARATGYAEMLAHAWLTPDHAVQQTRFANGVSVTVNFGDAAYTLPDGTTLPPLASRVTGVQPD